MDGTKQKRLQNRALQLRLGLLAGGTLSVADLIFQGGWAGLLAAGVGTAILVHNVPEFSDEMREAIDRAKTTVSEFRAALPYTFRRLDISGEEVERVVERIRNTEEGERDEKGGDIELEEGEERFGVDRPIFQLDIEDTGIKTFSQLIKLGVVQRMIGEDSKKPFLEKRVILGYVDGKIAYATIEDLYSCGIGGSSRMGKSTTVRFLLFQFILIGFSLAMIDPHITDVEESLAAQFMMFPDVHAIKPCGEHDQAIRVRVDALQREYDRRVELGEKGNPILFVVDEFNILMRSTKISDETKGKLTKLLLDIEQGGGKFRMYAWIIGQKWANQDLGNRDGVAVRTSLVSRVAHRFSDEEQAARFMGTNKAKLKEQNSCLVPGRYLFLSAGGTKQEVTTPPTFATDGSLVVSLLPNVPVVALGTSKHTENVSAFAVSQVSDENDDEPYSVLRAMPYKVYLRSRHWQRMRKLALVRDECRCRVCNQADTQLDVHHRTYERYGHEDLNDLTTLCHPCHSKHHDKLPQPPGTEELTTEWDDNPLSRQASHFQLENDLEMAGNGSTSGIMPNVNEHLHLQGNDLQGTPEHKKRTDPLVNVNASGVDKRTRELIRNMRTARPKPYTHAEISKLIELDGRKYAIYMQVCKEEGIE